VEINQLPIVFCRRRHCEVRVAGKFTLIQPLLLFSCDTLLAVSEIGEFALDQLTTARIELGKEGTQKGALAWPKQST
jgi:hypothetical protein